MTYDCRLTSRLPRVSKMPSSCPAELFHRRFCDCRAHAERNYLRHAVSHTIEQVCQQGVERRWSRRRKLSVQRQTRRFRSPFVVLVSAFGLDYREQLCLGIVFVWGKTAVLTSQKGDVALSAYTNVASPTTHHRRFPCHTSKIPDALGRLV